jgi:Tfp pilus assembly protein PilX
MLSKSNNSNYPIVPSLVKQLANPLSKQDGERLVIPHMRETINKFNPRSGQYLTRSRTMPTRAQQKGVTLLISLIVLVIMTLAGIQLMRSVDTSNIIAGNLAFQQSATHSGDGAIEAATAWLEQQNNAGSANLTNDNCANGYFSYYTLNATPIVANATQNADPPTAGKTWDTWWNTVAATACIVTLPTDVAGNTAYYTINRMCSQGGVATTTSATQYCSTSPILIVSGNNSSQTAGSQHLIHNGQIYYRITSRISGPRGTKSYVQAIVAL